MAVNLTRKELDDLVWAKPRSEIAKQFEISKFGRLCRQMHVPAPRGTTDDLEHLVKHRVNERIRGSRR